MHFKLLDSTGKTVAEGDTGTDGKLTFSGIALGSYTLKETATASGYVLDGTARPVTISTNGQTVEVRVTNEPATGKVVVVKTDADTGETLLGVHFKLTDSSGAVVKEGDTGADGTKPNDPPNLLKQQSLAKEESPVHRTGDSSLAWEKV